MNTYNKTLMNKTLTKKQLLSAVKAIPDDQDFVWDGIDEDERPVSPAEFATAIKKRGRPTGSQKEAVSLRLDKNVVEGFRAYGKGWQSKINQVLSDFLKQAERTGT
ncbi:BrnA antitoxin family protein [Mannheimia pernigra]|uniref:BrnA antitoxin family protein n=1 Tax=Mannheimia pernigra TaxID=111844 RepID=UPI001315F1B8|nr:BrnA antitoxin family protein [Mannheimia pernigra]QHB18095.1 hypothetical protein GM695_08680 [Mannheimia pernigra]